MPLALGRVKKKYDDDGKLSCSFCRQFSEQLEHIFQGSSGILCKKSLRRTTLYDFEMTTKDIPKTKWIGKFLVSTKKIEKFFHEGDCTLA